MSNKQLRQFGVVIAIAILLVFGWLPSGEGISLEVLFAAIAVGGGGLVLPSLLKPFYFAWMKLGAVLGWFNTRLILSIIYFFVFVPLGLLMRFLGKDLMNREIEVSKSSYRVEAKEIEAFKMERPY